MQNQFHSLRTRLLLPLLTVALLASVAVAVGSYALGNRWARDEVIVRYQAMEATLARATFPLQRQVITLIAELTDTELITLGDRGQVTGASIDLPTNLALDGGAIDASTNQLVVIHDQVFRYGVFGRSAGSNDRVAKVVVLFDEADLQNAKLRAAALPLISGLSTVLLLTTVTLLLAGRLIRRLSRLQQRVDRIAQGDFEKDVPIGVNDEVGMLGSAVTRMSQQLRQMWATLQRQQGEKLLHQIAGGLAHQLRNSITGARMAVELHQQACEQSDEAMSVALGQLGQTEQQIRRLLQVASGGQDQDHPQSIGQSIDDVQTTLSSTAKHLGVQLTWGMEDKLRDRIVADGASFSAAVSNLVLNALQEAQRVDVSIGLDDPDQVRIDVVDNGSGPDAQVADEIFEPFVTSKPEGLGLGLPLVARAAQRLGGTVKWKRNHDQTRFTLIVKVKASGA